MALLPGSDQLHLVLHHPTSRLEYTLPDKFLHSPAGCRLPPTADIYHLQCTRAERWPPTKIMSGPEDVVKIDGWLTGEHEAPNAGAHAIRPELQYHPTSFSLSLSNLP